MMVLSLTQNRSIVPRDALLSLYKHIMGTRYRADNTRDSIDPWPTPTSASQGLETKPPYMQCMVQPTRYEVKNHTISGANSCLQRIATSIL
jgi:hypothetical protein